MTTNQWPKIHISALMSMPRLSFTDNMFCALPIFNSLGIRLFRDSGAYWEQSLSRLMEEKVHSNHYLITVDYDSVFSRDDVLKLIELTIRHDADACFAMQLKRECDQAIVGVDEKQIDARGLPDFSGETTPAVVGHFGLTMIKCDTLKALPRPWLFSVPSPDGNWSHGPDGNKVDADIGFWMMAKHCGWKVLQANCVPIGHIQRVVTWPTRDMRVVHQYLNDYDAHGRPPEVTGEPRLKLGAA